MRDDFETEFGGIRLRSTIEIVEEEPGVLSFSIDGPIIELTEDDGESDK